MNWTGFYINLDRHEARRQAVEAELVKLNAGGVYQRFAAVDGTEVPLRPDIANRAELGCFLSHLEVIKRNVGSEKWLHVVEDDVLVSRHACAAIDMLVSLPGMESCDILFTNVLLPLDNWVISPFREAFDRSVTTAASGDVTSIKSVEVISLDRIDFLLTTSYLINPRSIGRVADLLTPYLDTSPFVPIDAVLQKLAHSGELRMLCSIPFFTAPRLSDESTIRPSASAWRISHLIMETALYADRHVAELQQLLAALGRHAEDSMTRDLIAAAYRYSISVNPDAPILS